MVRNNAQHWNTRTPLPYLKQSKTNTKRPEICNSKLSKAAASNSVTLIHTRRSLLGICSTSTKPGASRKRSSSGGRSRLVSTPHRNNDRQRKRYGAAPLLAQTKTDLYFPAVICKSRAHVVAEFEQFRLDQLSVIVHAHPNRFVVRAGLERDMVVLLQGFVHDNRQIV